MSLFPQSTADADWVVLSSGKSRGVGTTNIKATLFMRDESARLCLCCVGRSGLVACCEQRVAEVLTCGTRHHGAKFEIPEEIDLSRLVVVHDPKNRSRFFTGPWAGRRWFSESSLRVMCADSKTVSEWAEVFRIGRLQAYGDLEPATTKTIQEELDFVDMAHDLKTPDHKEWGIAKKSAGETTSPSFLSECESRRGESRRGRKG
jgi:hypothetical protein